MTTPAVPGTVVEALQRLLADSYALTLNTQFAHWNVEGPHFFALHRAFQEQYEALFEATDEIAERIRALNAYTLGGLSHFATRATVAEISAPASASELLAALMAGHEKAAASAAHLRDLAGATGDSETQDLAIERLQEHQKTVWMLHSSLR